MILSVLPLLPLVVGGVIAACGPLTRRIDERAARLVLGSLALVVLAIAFGIAVWAAGALPAVGMSWGGGRELSLALDPLTRLVALLVPAVAAPVVVWAAAHEDADGLARLIGGLVAFAGAMELLVLASDLIVLLIGWELVGALSFVLIAHRHDDDDAVASATYAFNATRLGGLGLFVAAGATFAATGSFGLEGSSAVVETSFGDLFAAGVLWAAASKSAQVPFAPWLMRAMAGPSSVSALLHSSTMVAAGAWLLVRLHEPLMAVVWFGPVAIGIGLSTAVVGGISAATQQHAKRLLAASTSAQYGLMFAAAGAGAAGAALAHLVTHAFLKALLFLAAGTAISTAGTASLGRMALGKALPVVAAASAVAAAALAAVPPLGAAWSKELVVAATAHAGATVAIVTVLAAGLSAFYAARFQLLVFGRSEPSPGVHSTVSFVERISLAFLGLCCLALSALWLPAVHEVAASWASVTVPKGAAWELPVSVGVAFVGVGGAWVVVRARSLRGDESGTRALAADWLGLPRLIDRVAVQPALTLAAACARFDDRVVDAGVRASAWLGRRASSAMARLVESGLGAAVDGAAKLALHTGKFGRHVDDRRIDASVEAFGRGVRFGGRNVQRLQSGAVPLYYVLAVGGLLCMALLLWLGRSFE